MRQKPRKYQSEAMNAIIREWDSGVKRTLLVLPTGCGKTLVFTGIIYNQVSQGKRVLVLAHRDELIQQAVKRINSHGIKTCSERGKDTCAGHDELCVVSSVQTMARRKEKFERDYFDVIVIDEAHHVRSNTYLQVIDFFKDSKVLGVTATPDRADKKTIMKVFQTVAYQYSILEAVQSGYLARPITEMVELPPISLKGVKRTAGDYQSAGLGHAIEPYLHSIADELREKYRDRKIVIFLPLIKTAEKMTEIMNTRGFRAIEVNGVSDNRTEIIESFAAGEYNVICNAILLTEGWDCPDVDCVVVLRPTTSRSLYIQMVGRGLRLAPGKTDCKILNFYWDTGKIDICSPASILIDDPKVKAKIDQTEGDLLDLLEDAKQKVDLEETAARKLQESQELIRRQKASERLRNRPDLKDPAKDSRFKNELIEFRKSRSAGNPVTDSQAKALIKMGLDPSKVCKEEINLLFDLNNRITPKQKFALSKILPSDTLEKLDKKMASTLIGMIHKKLPDSLICRKAADMVFQTDLQKAAPETGWW